MIKQGFYITDFWGSIFLIEMNSRGKTKPLCRWRKNLH